MKPLSKCLFRAIFVASSGLTAAAIGITCLVLINLAPTVIWGDEVSLASAYITAIPSMLVGFFAFAWFFRNVLEWLGSGSQHSQEYPSTPRLIFAGITIASGTAAIFIAVNGLYPQYFDLAWREEIRLSDGKLKVVEMRRTYERPGFRLDEFKNARLRRTQISFEPVVGEPRVSVTTQLQPVYLNQFDGAWYLVVAGGDDNLDRTAPKENWGNSYNTLGQRLAIMNGREFKPAPWDKAPRSIVFHNLLPTTIFDLAKVKATEKQVMSLAEKQTLIYRYVNTTPGPDPLRITRSEAMNTPLRAEYQEAIADLVKPP